MSAANPVTTQPLHIGQRIFHLFQGKQVNVPYIIKAFTIAQTKVIVALERDPDFIESFPLDEIIPVPTNEEEAFNAC